MAQVIRFHQTGGPEVLSVDTVDVGAPQAGQLKIDTVAAGLNFIDTYHRSGLYPVAELPAPIGLEGAGVVTEVGPDTPGFDIGDRVAFCTGGLGSYASARLVDASRMVKVPDTIDLKQAAAMMLKGQTAEYLLRRTFPVQAGQTILFHAAAGGVGQIAVQWAKALGVTVIGTVGSEAKADIARSLGCDHVINYSSEDIVARVKEITDGAGVPVVYDGVGKDTFEASLSCLAPRGMMVTFGNASGPPPAFDLLRLTTMGSLFITRPSLMAYCASVEDNQASAKALFDVVASGAVTVSVDQEYALKNAAQAHADLENRKTTGSTILIP